MKKLDILIKLKEKAIHDLSHVETFVVNSEAIGWIHRYLNEWEDILDSL